MSEDTTKDERMYSRHEVQEIIRDVVRETVDYTIKARWKKLIGLEVCGQWERGQVYARSSVVFFAGEQWIATDRTASEPSEYNPAWRRVHLSVLDDEITPPWGPTS